MRRVALTTLLFWLLLGSAPLRSHEQPSPSEAGPAEAETAEAAAAAEATAAPPGDEKPPAEVKTKADE